MQSVEHMFAAFIRNPEIRDSVICFGPMGCRTGFCLLTRDVPDEEALRVVKDMLSKILACEGPVFGASRKECGSWRNPDLSDAKRECDRYPEILNGKNNDFRYEA